MTIAKRVDALGGLPGYAARAGHTPLALDLTADGEHAIVATLLDNEGRNLSEQAWNLAIGPSSRQAGRAEFKDSTRIADGPADASRTIYVFTDTNCSYCYRFYDQSHAWVDAGRARLRQILVGILEPSSFGQAAAGLATDDRSAAYRDHERHYATGQTEPLADIPMPISNKITANNTSMARLNIRGTPGFVYRNKGLYRDPPRPVARRGVGGYFCPPTVVVIHRIRDRQSIRRNDATSSRSDTASLLVIRGVWIPRDRSITYLYRQSGLSADFEGCIDAQTRIAVCRTRFGRFQRARCVSGRQHVADRANDPRHGLDDGAIRTGQ